jgi:3-hydroxyisobutyrate dehydrogenase
MADSILPPERIGFVGLGNMGKPMARRLAAAGFALAVSDRDASVVERFAAEVPCERPAALRALGEMCRIVITMLPDGNAVRSVLLGPDGLAAGMHAGGIVIDMSSSAPAGTRQLAAELGSHELHLLDAPVSGGVRKAVDGTLAIMAGGDAAVLERCRAILECMGRVFAAGGSGTGHAMKALNNYLSAATLSVTAEAVLAGERFGLDPKTMIEILNASTGRSNSTELKYPAYILPRSFDSGFALGLMVKDLRLALELAHDVQAPALLLEQVAALWQRADQRLGAGADHTEIVRYLEEMMEEDARG